MTEKMRASGYRSQVAPGLPAFPSGMPVLPEPVAIASTSSGHDWAMCIRPDWQSRAGSQKNSYSVTRLAFVLIGDPLCFRNQALTPCAEALGIAAVLNYSPR